jgi:signal transduction histidine kinase
VQKFHLLFTLLAALFPPALFSTIFGPMYLCKLGDFFDNDMLFFTSLSGIIVSVSLGYGLIMENYINVSIEAQYHQRLAFIGLVDTKLMHDLRAPVTYIRHLSQTLASLLPRFHLSFRHEKSPDHEQISFISDQIYQQANNAYNFISSFREQLMQEKPQNSKVNIGKLIREAVSLIRLSTQKEVEINQRVDETLEYYLDKNSFLSVLVNVLQNSVDSFSESGRIDITGEVKDGYLKLEITDNGCGIKEEDIEKVFSIFYTTKSDSMGLGLFFVKQEVEKYGGKVSCKSKEGSGTTITITLPISKP